MLDLGKERERKGEREGERERGREREREREGEIERGGKNVLVLIELAIGD